MKNFLYLVCLSIVLFSCEKSKQNPNPDPTSTNQTILDSICVKSIAFDSEGTAWIGTLSQGLVKYSATETKIFDWTNSPLTNNPIWDITVDSQDNIWFANNGLVKYDGVEFTTYNTSNSDIPENVVMSLDVDSNDNIWLASSRFKQGGIAKFDGVNFTVFTPENSALPVNLSHAIAIDYEDNVWVSASENYNETYLIKISGELWTVYDSVDFKQKLSQVSDIAINSKNQVCGAINQSALSSRGTYPKAFYFDESSMETNAMEDTTWKGFESIMVDSNDHYWCTFGSGYAYYDGLNWNKTEAEIVDGYYQEAYFTIEQAPDGSIWIGKGKGIEIIDQDI